VLAEAEHFVFPTTEAQKASTKVGLAPGAVETTLRRLLSLRLTGERAQPASPVQPWVRLRAPSASGAARILRIRLLQGCYSRTRLLSR
jgi:hypothetical protein